MLRPRRARTRLAREALQESFSRLLRHEGGLAAACLFP